MSRALLALLAVILFAPLAAAADYASTVMEATFKLFHPDSTATCFFVRRPAPDAALYLVTAAHAIENAKGDSMLVVLRRPQADGSFERLDHKVFIRRADKPLWTKHEKHDVAVLRLTDPPPLAVSALPTEALADAARLQAAGAHIGGPLLVFTFPQRFEADQAGFPVARQGVFASPPLLPMASRPTFLADFTTFAGDSGGPVFMADAAGRPLVVGIVLALFRHDERVKTEYEERIIHHPLGLGTVLHAQFVRETIEAAARAPTPPKEESTTK